MNQSRVRIEQIRKLINVVYITEYMFGLAVVYARRVNLDFHKRNGVGGRGEKNS
jgi:hypothetical protein